MKSIDPRVWFFLRLVLFIGVIGWVVVYTGVNILLDIVLGFVLNSRDSIVEPYFRLEGETYTWSFLIRSVVGLVVWFFYAGWIWKKEKQRLMLKRQ